MGFGAKLFLGSFIIHTINCGVSDNASTTMFTSLCLALPSGHFIVVVTLSCVLNLSQIVRLHHLPVPQSHVVHLVAVGGREDVPLVDESPTAVKGRNIVPSEQCQEWELSNLCVISSNDKPSRVGPKSTLLLLQRRSVAGQVTTFLSLAALLRTMDLRRQPEAGQKYYQHAHSSEDCRESGGLRPTREPEKPT